MVSMERTRGLGDEVPPLTKRTTILSPKAILRFAPPHEAGAGRIGPVEVASMDGHRLVGRLLADSSLYCNVKDEYSLVGEDGADGLTAVDRNLKSNGAF
jgi:hypothetical protein